MSIQLKISSKITKILGLPVSSLRFNSYVKSKTMARFERKREVIQQQYGKREIKNENCQAVNITLEPAKLVDRANWLVFISD